MNFIPNDTVLGNNGHNIILLTGPNMGGKSTLLRQVNFFNLKYSILIDVYCSHYGPNGMLRTSKIIQINTF